MPTDEFQARSPDELSLARGDRVELIERDDDFGDGWFLGRNTESGDSGLFPEGTYNTCPAPPELLPAARSHVISLHPTIQLLSHL
jgi:hypothetical protein